MKVVRNNCLQYSSLRPGDVFSYSLTGLDCDGAYMVIDEVNDTGLYKHIDLENGGIVNPLKDFTVIKLLPTLCLDI